jgi:Raf kinase inhibitor-like YbhB/YbcL family protein
MVVILLALFALVSPQFTQGAALSMPHVWNRDGCHGGNRSPALHWTGAPRHTKSFALSVFDPDAGSAGWWHWIAFDLPPTQSRLPSNVAANAVGFRQGVNDFGTRGYGGPCPPPGPFHHYVFTLYALDIVTLGAGPAIRGAQLRRLVRGHVLATATLTGLYRR